MKFKVLKALSLLLAVLLTVNQGPSQTLIPIPPTLEGASIDLNLQSGSRAFFPGTQTATLGYNSAYLGPTLILQKGATVTLNVHNQLGDTTTTHWHGLHVASKNDGSPHNPILAGETWSPSFEVMDQAATYWYHPHLHGKTLGQVVKGASGLLIVRDAAEAALALPRTYGVDDVPLIFQWKTFDTDKQIVEMDEEDNEVLVNGVLRGAVLKLPAQVVRLRLLNGSSHRFFDFGFDGSLGFKQISGDGGLLNAPVSMAKLILAPGERAEILVDLSGKEGQTLSFKQFGTQLPQGYPGGRMMQMGGATIMGPLDDTDFELMKIEVGPATVGAVTAIPATLIQNAPLTAAGASARSFGFSAQPMMSMTNFFINNLKFDMETINFEVEKGATEVWTITNQTMMAHPFHVHGNSFWVVTAGAAANQKGRKDVVVVPPMGGQVKIAMRFEDFADPEMPFMYHCHILSHEDNGMMGQFVVTAPASRTAEAVASKLLFYPNPASETVFFEVEKTDPQKAVCQVTDVLGRAVWEQHLTLSDGRGSIQTEGLAAGAYALRVLCGGKTFTGIFVKQ